MLETVLGEDQKLFENTVGRVIYRETAEKDCSIDYVEINDNKRNNGEGQKLMQEFLNTMNSKGFTYFVLDAWIVHDAIYSIDVLVKFYQKVGFVEVDRMTEEGKVRVFMEIDNEI